MVLSLLYLDRADWRQRYRRASAPGVQTVAVDHNVAVETFAVGQYVELYPTIPSRTGGSTLSGTRGIVDAVDLSRATGDCYLVAFLSSEVRTGERAWVAADDLFPA
jgi:hypothetical protein